MEPSERLVLHLTLPTLEKAGKAGSYKAHTSDPCSSC